ncbi:MAG: signal peptidase I, partial [Planctomycetota bacterium]
MNAKNKAATDPSRRRSQQGISIKGRHAGQGAVEQVIAVAARYLSGHRGSNTDAKSPSASRETVESIVVAVILAFLFRGFVAEAFVIPTGSMAPTLRGRHMDIVCEKCDFEYNTGASMENEEDGRASGEVTVTCCPICNFPRELEKAVNPNERSFNGDRILVSKFAYQLSEPERWDVIVFKYPGNAKQNYIKRLVGLPGETIQIRHGDIHTIAADGHAEIVRKPPAKLKAMLHVVDDTDHVAPALKKVGWPSRWQPASAVGDDRQWRQTADDRSYILQSGGEDTWLRYRHLAPHPSDWEAIEAGAPPRWLADTNGALITDYYSYNDSRADGHALSSAWVGDLAFESKVEIQSDQGELLLDLVEGGTHYRCRIDVATGNAALSITDFDGQPQLFADGNAVRTAATSMKGPGSRGLRFSNCDDQMLLWIDNRVVEFDGPTTYEPPVDVVPKWSPDEPGDMAPVGIGGKDLKLSVSSLRVLRDIYYLAQEADSRVNSEYSSYMPQRDLEEVFYEPRTWETTTVFQDRQTVEFQLGGDQFFPLGDNSPQSKDARLWSHGSHGNYHSPPPYVARE